MRDLIRLIYQLVKHRWLAANSKGHGVHSPFFFDFIRNVLPDGGHLPELAVAEKYRQDLLKDQTPFERTDLGGGSRKPLKLITVSAVATRSLQSARWSRLLYRILLHYRPGAVLELGTSFGVTTEYLASVAPDLPVCTLEGDPFIAGRAADRFKADGFKNIELVQGNFDQTLQQVLSRIDSLGFIWLDGNHRKEPTLRYVEQILPYVKNDTILILDDIYWSREMQEAWESIKTDPRVRATIDLYRIGIVLFRKEFLTPLHIRLHY